MTFPIPRTESGENAVLFSALKLRGHALILALILVLALVLRAAGIVWGEAYNYGTQSAGVEAYEVAVAYQTGDARAQYLGHPNFKGGSKLPGPAWTLVCVLGLGAWGSIDGVSWLLALFNVASIYLIYLLASKTVGPTAGLAAAALIAVSPLAIHHSIPVYNPAILPFLSALVCLALWHVLQHDHSRAIGGVVFLLFLMLQFHTSGLALIPAVLVLVWLAGRPLNRFWLLLGCLAGLALYVPYITGEMANDWGNARAIYAAAGTSRPRELLRAILAPLSFLVNYWPPRQFYTPAEFQEMCEFALGGVWVFRASNVLATIVALLLVAKALWLGREALRGRWKRPREAFAREPGIIFLGVLYVIPLATEFLTGPTFYPRYALVLFPPLFSLAGAAAVAWLVNPRFGRGFAFAGAALIVLNAWFMLATYRYQRQHLRQAPHFLASFRRLDEVYASMRTLAGEGRAVEVDDRHFFAQSQAQKSDSVPDTALIRRYARCREIARTRGASASETETVVFELRPGTAAAASPADAAFAGNGIRVVRAAENKGVIVKPAEID